MKIKYILCLPLLALALAAAKNPDFFSGLSPLRESGVKTQVDFTRIRKIDRLYTAFIVVPVTEIDLGRRKRDYIPFIGSEEKRIMGGCKRTFEVTIGYENIESVITDDLVVDKICSHGISGIPSPRIIDINGIETQIFGRDDGSCSAWDNDRNKLEERISEVIVRSGIYNEIESRSKHTFENLISVFCNRDKL
ncbi:MAG: hypothetical protein LBQ63_02675 [Deltaproteobacteria bacterium]|jgi:hypothetical protein|nr:hypothetical protein [Deltaproteobacteria bacterium]